MSTPQQAEARLWMYLRYAFRGILAFASISLLYASRAALTPVIAAWVLAYILCPIIDRAEKRGISRTRSISALLFFVVGFFVLVTLLFLPYIAREGLALFQRLASQSTTLISWVETTFHVKIPSSLSQTFEEYGAQLKQIAPSVASWTGSHIAGLFEGIGTAFGFLINAIFIPVFTFYFLRDFHKIKEYFLSFVPHSYRSYTAEKLTSIDHTLGGFLHGQIIVAFAQAVLLAVGLAMLGVEFGFVIGFCSGIASVIPYVGLGVGVTLALLMALLSFHGWFVLLSIVGLFVLVHLFEGFYLTPRFVGSRVGLSSVAVLVSLLIFGELLGTLGLLLAVPMAAVLRILWSDLERQYRDSNFFLRGKMLAFDAEVLKNLEEKVSQSQCSCGGSFLPSSREELPEHIGRLRLRFVCTDCQRERELSLQLRELARSAEGAVSVAKEQA